MSENTANARVVATREKGTKRIEVWVGNQLYWTMPPQTARILAADFLEAAEWLEPEKKAEEAKP